MILPCVSQGGKDSKTHTQRRESQNGGAWRGPLEITLSNPLAKAAHLEQDSQYLMQVGFESLQRKRL